MQNHKQLIHGTVSFLVKDKQVLLGYKKTGFGQGKYVGIGGKIETGESAETAVAREITEEIFVSNPLLQKVAEIIFLFPHKPNWSQYIQVFICKKWQGEPVESNEIRPEWFSQQNIPFEKMWDDAQFWLPKILTEETFQAEFVFNEELRVEESKIIQAKF